MSDVLAELARANPVDVDRVQPGDSLTARVLDDRSIGAARRLRRAGRLTGGVVVAALAAAVLVIRVTGLGGDRTDLADRAYAAARPVGIVHWRIEIAGYADDRLGSRQRVEGWSLGSVSHILHSDVIHGKAHVTLDERIAGHRSRAWLSGANDYSTGPAGRPTVEPIPSGDPLLGFRLAYRSGRLRNLGEGRFELTFPHLPRGSVIYQVDAATGAPRTLVVRTDRPARLGLPAFHGKTVVRFTRYEHLPVTEVARSKLEMLPHPGAGPGHEQAARFFAALRSGPAPAGAYASQLRQFATDIGSHYRIDPDATRELTPGIWLLAGTGYVCIARASTAGGVAGIGGGCATVRKARRDGISTGTPEETVIAVPDGTRAVEARLHWHGPWRRYPVRDGVARLPGLGYQARLVR